MLKYYHIGQDSSIPFGGMNEWDVIVESCRGIDRRSYTPLTRTHLLMTVWRYMYITHTHTHTVEFVLLLVAKLWVEYL